MKSTPIYSHCCPAITDDTGKRISGCNKGWTSEVFKDKCSTCGKSSQIRGQYVEVHLNG